MYREWPSEENPSKFKFQSITINMGQKETRIERSTYSLLEWIGDIGGLFDGLRYLANFFVAPIAVFLRRSMLLSDNLFHLKESIGVRFNRFQKLRIAE